MECPKPTEWKDQITVKEMKEILDQYPDDAIMGLAAWELHEYVTVDTLRVFCAELNRDGSIICCIDMCKHSGTDEYTADIKQ